VVQDIIWSIEAGVIIKMSFGGYENLTILGVLSAIGTENQKIVFTSLMDDTISRLDKALLWAMDRQLDNQRTCSIQN